MPPERGLRSWLGRIFGAAVASGLALAVGSIDAIGHQLSTDGRLSTVVAMLPEPMAVEMRANLTDGDRIALGQQLPEGKASTP